MAQIHEIDKKMAVVEHEIKEIVESIGRLASQLESVTKMQSEIYHHLMPKYEVLSSEIGNLKKNVYDINERHKKEDFERDARNKFVSFSFKNWKMIIAIFVAIFGLYEGGKTLYLMPSPKYNAHYEVEK